MQVTWDSLGISSGITGPDVKLKETLNAVLKKPSADKAEISSSVRRKQKRDAEYKVVEKDISKYHSIISAELRPERGETVVLGHHEDSFNPLQSLTADVEAPADGVEGKLRNIVSKLKKSRREAAERLFPKAAGHQEANILHIERELRKLMASELKEAKRLKSIKSKGHRKVQRKKDQKEQAKLMERLLQEDPNAAERLREEWELKRAETRMMLGTRARRQWAKMAKRFGGKDLERTINAAHMDAESFKQYLNTMSGKTAADLPEPSDDSTDDDEQTEDQDKSEKGIWNMPFMKRAREIKDIQRENGIDAKDDFSVGRNDLPDEETEVKNFLQRKREGLSEAVSSNTPTLQQTEAKSRESGKTNSVEFSLGEHTTKQPVEKMADPATDLLAFVMKPKKALPVKPKAVVEAVEEDSSRFNDKFFSPARKSKSSVEITNDKESFSQSELVRMAFQINGDDAEEDFASKLEAEELAAVELEQSKEKPTVLEGWGNWCAAGYISPRVQEEKEKAEARLQKAKTEKLKELKRRGLVKVHPAACKPADKYLARELPKNFKSPEHYTAAMRRHIGDQFVSPLASQIAKAPKQEVIKGRVLSALKAEIVKE